MKKGKKKMGRPPGGVNGLRVRDYPQVAIRIPPTDFARWKVLQNAGFDFLGVFMKGVVGSELELAKRRRQNATKQRRPGH